MLDHQLRTRISLVFVLFLALITSVLWTMKASDTSAWADGVYIGSGQGYADQIKVEVIIKGGSIAQIEVISHHDTPGIADLAINQIPEKIILAQHLDVDVVTNATKTSQGIMEAVAAALALE